MTAVLSTDLTAVAPRTRLRAVVLGVLANPRRALLVAVLLAIATVGFDALSDPDVWWHVRLGQWMLANHRVPTAELFSYTAAGNPMTAHEWLSDTIFAALNGLGGLFAVALVMGVACWSGFVVIALRAARRGAGPVSCALGLALGAKAAEPVLGARPQVFTFVLISWVLLAAESYLHSGGRRRWLIPLVVLVWANLHAGFVAGLGALVLVLVAETAKRLLHESSAAPWQRIRGLLVVSGTAALAACVNPAGPSLYHFALTVSATEGQKGIVEWLSPNFHDPGLWALLALIVSFAVMPALGARLDLRDALLAAAGTALALTAVRDTAICVALVTPGWIAMAAGVARARARRSTGVLPRPRTVSLAACVAGAAVVGTGGATAAAGVARMAAQTTEAGVAAAYPSCVAAVLSRAPNPQRVFSVYGNAGYLINRLYPRARVYEYGESISLGFSVFRDYQRIAAGATTSPSALQLLERSGTTAVVYPAGELTAELDRTSGWTRVLRDQSGTLLYVRGSAAWAAGTTGCSVSS